MLAHWVSNSMAYLAKSVENSLISIIRATEIEKGKYYVEEEKPSLGWESPDHRDASRQPDSFICNRGIGSGCGDQPFKIYSNHVKQEEQINIKMYNRPSWFPILDIIYDLVGYGHFL